ncbi:hypothetical protein [Kitasatospora sp. NPDC050543]|uniref:hypothetical protein n=1 Tax=Kitasatospora sp. NPDC050543 TaxID=3364054 RepID=UPI0037A050D7
MTVLHSRNADAADESDLAEAPATTDTAPDLREELGRYAELGAFTLSADTHAWYAAVDTVATPEDARAASTVLAELRGRDLQQVWETVVGLAADAGLSEPGTVAEAALLVELLQRVHRTAGALHRGAYAADLDALTAATAGSAWRKERGIKLSWLRARALRKQAQSLAVVPRARREDLHEALAAAEVERRAWAVFAPEGARPVPPANGEPVEAAAQDFEAIGAGLAELARLLPANDLEAQPFKEIVDLVERLAADEGTLYRLPTIRALRTTLEQHGLADLLAELTTANADRRAAEAAYQRHTGGLDAARQALAGGQRDGQSEDQPEAEAAVAAETADVDVVVEVDVEVEPTAEAVAEPTVEVEPAVELAAETDVEPEAAQPAEAEVTPEADVEPAVEAEAGADIVVAETAAEPVIEADVEPDVPAVAEAAADPVTVEASDADIEPVAEAAEVELIAESDAEAVTEAEAAVDPESEQSVEPLAEAVVAEEPFVVEPVEAPVEPAVEVMEVMAAEPEVDLAPVAAPEAAPVAAAEPAEVVTEEPAEAVTEEPAPARARTRRPKKPAVTPGRPVTAYSADELLAVVRWIDSDAVERSDEDLLRAAMKELGFARLGPRIKEALGAAVTEARS